MSQHISPSIELKPVMDFGALPPETNSGRLHSGPGAESLMEAARAWRALGAELGDMALNYRAVFGEWKQSGSARALNHAVAAYSAWLEAAAAQAHQTATQAEAAAGAYGLTRAAVVAPPVIDANRRQRVGLAATNCLGQLSPAIADAEAAYDRMWAQDAAAMYAYARAAAGIWKLRPFSSPPPLPRLREEGRQGAAVTKPSRRWRLQVAPEVITAGAQVISTISEALDALASSPLASFDVSLLPIAAQLSRLSSLSAPRDLALNRLNALNKSAALASATAVHSRLVTGAGADGAAPRVIVGRRATVGVLSVPPAWIRSMPGPAWPSPQASTV